MNFSFSDGHSVFRIYSVVIFRFRRFPNRHLEVSGVGTFSENFVLCQPPSIWLSVLISNVNLSFIIFSYLAVLKDLMTILSHGLKARSVLMEAICNSLSPIVCKIIYEMSKPIPTISFYKIALILHLHILVQPVNPLSRFLEILFVLPLFQVVVHSCK